MKQRDFAEFKATAERQQHNSAWLAEWPAGEVRQSTGSTLAAVNDGCNSVMIVLSASVVSRLAEHERDCARIAELAAAS